MDSIPNFLKPNSDDLKIHTGDGSTKESSFAIKSIPLNKGTHIVDLDCMGADQRKKSSETFAIGTSDGIQTRSIPFEKD